MSSRSFMPNLYADLPEMDFIGPQACTFRSTNVFVKDIHAARRRLSIFSRKASFVGQTDGLGDRVTTDMAIVCSQDPVPVFALGDIIEHAFYHDPRALKGQMAMTNF